MDDVETCHPLFFQNLLSLLFRAEDRTVADAGEVEEKFQIVRRHMDRRLYIRLGKALASHAPRDGFIVCHQEWILRKQREHAAISLGDRFFDG